MNIVKTNYVTSNAIQFHLTVLELLADKDLQTFVETFLTNT